MAKSFRVTSMGMRADTQPGARFLIGSSEGANLRISDDGVAQEHCWLTDEPDGWWLTASPGAATFIDGTPIERSRLHAGETVVRLLDPDSGPWLRISPVEETTVRSSRPALRIGREPGNDIFLDDLLVSRHHAEIRQLPDGEWEIEDLGSFNGTFLNGRAIDRAEIHSMDAVGIGQQQYRFEDGSLEPIVDHGDTGFAAVGIGVTTGNRTLVSDVHFPVAKASLVAVVGPSGSGKSTLLSVLTGQRKPDSGSVWFAGRDLHESYANLRPQIGYVPQSDIVHPELTVLQSLEYAAELRFPPDTSSEERSARVNEVMLDLELSEHQDTAVRNLSGGQRKRVSIGIELLGRPTLLFLDEPTSGLDPGLERSVMELLRRLADEGRMVVVVTHSVDSLNLCDRLLLLAPGGMTAFYGPPQLAVSFFERADYQEVFRDLSEGDPGTFAHRFRGDEFARRYVEGPLGTLDATSQAPAQVVAPRYQIPRRWAKQYFMLVRRTIRVFVADRVNFIATLGAAPALGLLALWALPAGELEQLPPNQIRVVSQASIVLFIPIFGMTMLGLSNGIREISKEIPIVRRERAAGLSFTAYLAAKTSVLASLTVLQALVFVPIALARQSGPSDALILGSPRFEIAVIAALSGIAAVATSLCLSALLKSTAAALASLPLVLVFHVLCGSQGIFPASDQFLLREIGYVSTARWGFAAAASTANLNELQRINNIAAAIPVVDLLAPDRIPIDALEGGKGDSAFDHKSRAWIAATTVLILSTCGWLTLTWLALRRIGPG